jgi:hypothetical protein
MVTPPPYPTVRCALAHFGSVSQNEPFLTHLRRTPLRAAIAYSAFLECHLIK